MTQQRRAIVRVLIGIMAVGACGLLARDVFDHALPEVIQLGLIVWVALDGFLMIGRGVDAYEQAKASEAALTRIEQSWVPIPADAQGDSWGFPKRPTRAMSGTEVCPMLGCKLPVWYDLHSAESFSHDQFRVEHGGAVSELFRREDVQPSIDDPKVLEWLKASHRKRAFLGGVEVSR